MKILDENLDLLAKLMSVSSKRHEVHAANLANLNTPGYVARDVKFEAAFRNALKESGPGSAMNVEAAVVESDAPKKADGNSVHLEREFNVLQKNQMIFNVYAQILKHELQTIKRAIGGSR